MFTCDHCPELHKDDPIHLPEPPMRRDGLQDFRAVVHRSSEPSLSNHRRSESSAIYFPTSGLTRSRYSLKQRQWALTTPQIGSPALNHGDNVKTVVTSLSTSTGDPFSRNDLYFHVFTAFSAAPISIAGPLITFKLVTSPLVMMMTFKTTVPDTCAARAIGG